MTAKAVTALGAGICNHGRALLIPQRAFQLSKNRDLRVSLTYPQPPATPRCHMYLHHRVLQAAQVISGRCRLSTFNNKPLPIALPSASGILSSWRSCLPPLNGVCGCPCCSCIVHLMDATGRPIQSGSVRIFMQALGGLSFWSVRVDLLGFVSHRIFQQLLPHQRSAAKGYVRPIPSSPGFICSS